MEPGPQGFRKGKVGTDITVREGYQFARNVGLSLLATTREALESLDIVKRIVKVFEMVNCAPGFGDRPKVIDGFSGFNDGDFWGRGETRSISQR
jgi:hypothetical protein